MIIEAMGAQPCLIAVGDQADRAVTFSSSFSMGVVSP